MRFLPLSLLVLVLPFLATASGCKSSAEEAVGVACKAAGGTCLLGGVAAVAPQAPASAQDCNPDENAGGATCHLPGADASPSRADAGSQDAALPACSWPAIYNVDASTVGASGACTAGRAYLACTGSNGGGELCVSDSLTQCPGPNATPGVTYSNCQNQCHDDEYVLICGAIGPPMADASATSTPPAACRPGPDNPSGREPYCCPCNP